MKPVISFLKDIVSETINAQYPDQPVTAEQILVNETKPDFEGDYSIVLFPFLKSLRVKPEILGNQLGEELLRRSPNIARFQVVGGFLNLVLSDQYWLSVLDAPLSVRTTEPQTIMVEYSSPNTNKPLHFGHLRNNFLGWSVAEILKEVGHKVIKSNLINDRGIHICKSMVAWKRFANGATPEATGVKGDHLVGDYYVRFNDEYKKEVDELVGNGQPKEEAEKEAPILKEAQDLLVLWEEGDPDTIRLWERMNDWVYQGFDETYQRLQIDFDKVYYESQTYLLGKKIVEEGLNKGMLHRKKEGSVWVDLEDEGLDEKLLLRQDGTSVYMTQDLGTARLKYNDFQLDKSIYVIGDEQNHHMQVLKATLEKLKEPCAKGIYHLSYGMVELPSGRMKSREGTVVDADDMIDEMIRLATEQTEQSGKTEGFVEAELQELYQMIGLGALKFYLLRVEPKKKMIFDPKESIDLHGFTATFIQYAHARICSILRRVQEEPREVGQQSDPLLPLEKQLLLQIEQLGATIEAAALSLNPSLICNYAFRLAQTFNSFFDQHSVVRAETEEKKHLRLALAAKTAQVLKKSMSLLGISVPKRM